MKPSTPLPSSFSIPLLLLVAAGVAANYWTVVPKLARDLWTDPNFSHGLLVPFFSAFLVWQQRGRLKAFPQGDWGLPGLAGVAVALILLVVGKVAGEYFTMRLSLVVMVGAIHRVVFGRSGFRDCAFPLLFLGFMIPVPYILYDSVSFPLKMLSSRVAEVMLSEAGIPVFREGNVLVLPSLRMEVVDACSGIRSLMTFLTLAAVAGHIRRLRGIGWPVLLAAVIPVTVLVNSLRLFLTGVLSLRFGSGAAEGHLHEALGLAVFGVGLVIVALAAHLLRPRR